MHFYLASAPPGWCPGPTPLYAPVFSRNPHRRLHQTFALFALSLVSWNFDIAALYFFADYERALHWSGIFRYGRLFIPPTVYQLALALTERRTIVSRLLVAVGYWSPSFLALLDLELIITRTPAYQLYSSGSPCSGY